jgi:2-polyprenyl-3-methyl-5-hydroxy-6-metoxy-1,4-benzoquinol methylase
MSAHPRVGILIVAYNAVTTLTKVLRRIPEHVWDTVEEVVVFDDASHDDTYELALGYKALNGIDKLTVLKNEQNLGYGGNQKAGYRYFIDKGFDAVVLLHGDGQYAPEMLADMYAPILSGEADAVFGSRMMGAPGAALRGGMPLYKYAGNKILTAIENRLLNMQLTEFHSGYRAYSVNALSHIDFSRMTDVFHFDTEIIIKLKHQGMRIKEIPIPTYYGDEICYVDGVKYAKDVVNAVLRYRRTVAGSTSSSEFAEYFPRYPIVEGKYSSHYWCRQMIGENQDVLDVGCGDGWLASQLAQQGNRVVGVDAITDPVRTDIFEKYVRADLSNGISGLESRLDGRKFDWVVMADVLEHLPNPTQILEGGKDLLKSNGRVCVSLPNVANLSVRLALLFGRFNYADRGILDRTHLRFYTRTSASALLKTAGYEVLEQKTTVIPLERILPLSPESPILRWMTALLATFTSMFPGLLGYQSVFVARPAAKTPIRDLAAAQRTA